MTNLRWLPLAIALLPAASLAALGGPRAGIELDRSHLVAHMAASTMGAVHVATLQPANGGTVREYSTTGGTVFAVTWSGPGRPDLRQLLGDRFAALPEAGAARRGRRTARMMRVDRAELVVRSQGRPGAFSGVAYDPRLVPTDFAIDALR